MDFLSIAAVFFDQILQGHLKNPCKSRQLDIGDKALAGFDALYGIFVDVQSVDLQAVSQDALRDAEIFSVDGHIPAAEIISAVCRFVDKHDAPPLD